MDESTTKQKMMDSVTQKIKEELDEYLTPLNIRSTIYQTNISEEDPTIIIKLHAWHGESFRSHFDIDRLHELCYGINIQETSTGTIALIISNFEVEHKSLDSVSDIDFVVALNSFLDRGREIKCALSWPCRQDKE